MDTQDSPRFIATFQLDVVLLLLAAIGGSVDVMSYFQFHTLLQT